MSPEGRVVEAFAARRPSEAARVLEGMPQDEVQALLDKCHPSVAAAVIQAMLPPAAARYLTRASEFKVAEVFDELPLDRTADLLRRLLENDRARLLSNLSQDRRVALEKLLRYPESSAGALMEPRVACFHLDQTVAESIAEVRREGSDIRYYLYVVGDDHLLQGVVSLRDLLSAKSEATLRSIMKQPVASLSARAGRSAIVKNPAWQRYPLLPVVDEKERLLGIFRYETLAKLKKRRADDEAPSPMGAAIALSELFWLGATGLFRGWEESADD